MSRMKPKLYLDNAASTKPHPEVFKAMTPYLTANYGNPSSIHSQGREAKAAIDNSRQQIASILNCQPREIIFTNGGTESINLAIQGVAKAYARNYLKLGHIIVSAIEHEAVLETVKALEGYGWKIDFLPVDKNGLVDADQILKLVKPNTALVSVMYANNEVGTIEPIAELGSKLAGINRKRLQKKQPPVYLHSDACQAGGALELDVQKLKVDLLTLNGSKLQGPKGSGILYKKSSVAIEPIIYGGGQEWGLRSGTENVANIVGFATALELAQANRTKHAKQLFELQKHTEKLILKNIPKIKLNGPTNNKFASKEFNLGLAKLPGTINFSIPGIEGEALMIYLDALGYAVATGSACTTASTDASHVLLAMGVKETNARSTIRLSLSHDMTKKQLDGFVNALVQTINKLHNTTQSL